MEVVVEEKYSIAIKTVKSRARSVIITDSFLPGKVASLRSTDAIHFIQLLFFWCRFCIAKAKISGSKYYYQAYC